MRIVRHLIGIVLLSVLAVSGMAEDRFVYRIVLDGDVISPVTAEYIETSIARAQADGAAALVIELDTPGGLLTSTRRIVKDIMSAGVPVMVYVAPSGARAGSAGVFITLAAHVAAMAPSTNIGAAHPVELKDRRSTEDTWRDLIRVLSKKGRDEKEEKTEDDIEPMEQKILNDTEAWARSIAAFRGRNEEWAVRAVGESISETDGEALAHRVIDLVVPDVRTLIDRADGRPAMLPAGLTKIETKGARIIDLPMGFRLKWLGVLAHPNIAYILLMLGFYGLLFEFTHPGIGFPGIAGAICLVLAFFGLQVLPTNYAGVALIVLAIILFIAEVKITSYGLLTLGGLVSLFFGSLILFASPYEYMRVSLPLVLSFVAATFIIAAGLATLVIRSHRKKATTGVEGLVGERGEVSSVNGPHLKVFVHGELWDAACDEIVQEGDAVTVVRVDGMKLIVSK